MSLKFHSHNFIIFLIILTILLIFLLLFNIQSFTAEDDFIKTLTDINVQKIKYNLIH
jgi:hypothetical protein